MIKLYLIAVSAFVFTASFAHADEHRSLPQQMVGEWCLVKDSNDEYERHDCRRDGGDRMMTIGKHHWFALEDGCDFTKVQKLERNVYYVHGDCGGEGMTWKDTMIIQLMTNGHIRLMNLTHSNEKQEG
jgi:hypothetical protein